MDPNTLDPKLKATYDRVMGTQTVPGQALAAQAQAEAAQTPPPANAVNPVISTTMPPTQGAPISPTPAAAFTADNLSFQAAIQAPVNAGVPVAGTPGQAVPKQASSTIKILYIIGSVVFFIVYAFVWIKIFNIPLPF